MTLSLIVVALSVTGFLGRQAFRDNDDDTLEGLSKWTEGPWPMTAMALLKP